MPLVGTGYSYLQEYLPNVAQAVVREGWVDFVGLGRMVLSYPELPADTLAGRPLVRKKICRTFSDCTSARATASFRVVTRSIRTTKNCQADQLVAIKQQWQS